jgi:hypothetical protein
MQAVFRNPRTISAKIRNIRDTSKLLIRVHFPEVFLTHATLSTKLTTLLREPNSVADLIWMDSHHFGLWKEGSAAEKKEGSRAPPKQNTDPDLYASVCRFALFQWGPGSSSK